METELPNGHLERLRRYELMTVSEFLPSGAKVLDIGGGTGYQASLISQRGCSVVSIDVPDSGAYTRFFAVAPYDGVHIPAQSETFDVIFSSNVLEHVRELKPLLHEIGRVLKQDGVAVHILPSTTWRLWTTIGFYPTVLKMLIGKGESVPGAQSVPATLSDLQSKLRKSGVFHLIKEGLFGPFRRHGEFANALSELFFFSRFNWKRRFRDAGFLVEDVSGNGLFYTGNCMLPYLSWETRRTIGCILGSSCNIFILRKRPGIWT